MDTQYVKIAAELAKSPVRWLVTGAAGFIGSNILQALLKLNQHVTGLDNFSTGHRQNLEEVEASVLSDQWSRFRFIEGDIRDAIDCREACEDVQYVLHQAALGSVPRSVEDPLRSHSNNVDGFLNIIMAARDAKVRIFVYASSSSVYGDNPDLPKVEDRIGQALSPYAATKYINEIYAGVFARNYKLTSVGLRYFNVFGPRQNPAGAYAAVIPKWISQMIAGEDVIIYGDGNTSRDFCYIENVILANLLAATSNIAPATSQIVNIACGDHCSLRDLYNDLQECLSRRSTGYYQKEPQFTATRMGDVRHSLADISKAAKVLGYTPVVRCREGLQFTVDWILAKSLRS